MSVGQGLTVSHQNLLARSAGNFRKTMSIIRGRMMRRPAVYSHVSWPAWLALYVVLTAAGFMLLDTAAAAWRHGLAPDVVALAEHSTDFGLGGWYLIPPAIMLMAANLLNWRALSRRWCMVAYNWTSFAFFMLSAAGLSGLAVTILKHIFGRARPNVEDMGIFSFHPFAFSASFASFPSGHATMVGSAAGMLLLLAPRWVKYVLVAFTVWIAVTRVVVGMHYPSDTIAGFGLGIGCTVIVALVFARLGFIFQRTRVGLPVRRDTFRLRFTAKPRISVKRDAS